MSKAGRKPLATPNRNLPVIVGLALGSLALFALAAWTLKPGTTYGESNEPVVINGTAVPPVPALVVERVAAGEKLYTQYCAACHGARLEGAPNWKQPLPTGSYPPPPHDTSGHTWHHPDAQLLQITANGGDPAYNGTMPGFSTIMTVDQMSTIFDFIKSHWGREEREYQWWISVTAAGR